MPHRLTPSRRSFLRTAAALGLGATIPGASWSSRSRLALAAAAGNGHPLAPVPAHFPPRANRLLFVFLTGGFSHLDTFDEKPRLTELHGQPIPAFGLRPDEARKQPLLRSPFQFRTCGRSGLRISELFPRLGELADELCVIRSLHTDIVEHFQAALAMHTGSATVPLPSIGSWLSYALGSYNPSLPSYVVFAEHLPYGGGQVWDASFLPPIHAGVRLVPGAEPLPHLRPPVADATLAELERRMLDDLNRRFAESRPEDVSLRGRNQSVEIARGMMREAPEVFDLSRESPTTLELYGLERGEDKSFAWQCLMARRLIEKGVRVVELIDTGASNNWDAHGNMQDHVPKARRVDRPLAVLLSDLKQRGLLEDTLVAICTEFGRTPWTDGSGTLGRNHYAKAFSCLLAGAGVRGGTTYGETDELGREIVKDPVHVHDYHATILHLMGIDHTKLTYRYAGRDFRLTDVHGRVVQDILV